MNFTTEQLITLAAEFARKGGNHISFVLSFGTTQNRLAATEAWGKAGLSF